MALFCFSSMFEWCVLWWMMILFCISLSQCAGGSFRCRCSWSHSICQIGKLFVLFVTVFIGLSSAFFRWISFVHIIGGWLGMLFDGNSLIIPMPITAALIIVWQLICRIISMIVMRYYIGTRCDRNGVCYRLCIFIVACERKYFRNFSTRMDEFFWNIVWSYPIRCCYGVHVDDDKMIPFYGILAVLGTYQRHLMDDMNLHVDHVVSSHNGRYHNSMVRC